MTTERISDAAIEAARSLGSDENEATAGSVFVFRIGTTMLALDVTAVVSVLEAQEPVPIPRTPPHIRGFTVVNDQAVVVVDAARLLGLTRAQDERRFVVVRAGPLTAALDVDRAFGVAALVPSALHPPQALVGEQLRPLLRAEFERGSVCGLLDAARLLEAAKA